MLAGEAFSTRTTPTEPLRVSHYEIVRKLGEGGMGVVYQARDTDLGRFVALKFLPPQIAHSDDLVARFRREARAISALNHPHIATIYGMEDTGEAQFLVLEYLAGGTLRDALKRPQAAGMRLPLAQAMEWAIQISEGLDHAHRNGIIHRDLKSSNVLLTEDGQLKLADFGLAKSSCEHDSGPITQTGIAMGTPVYMAPEVLCGAEADQRSDIFSLGVLLFEMIAGERPFHGGKEGQLYQTVWKPAPALSQVRADVPLALEAMVAKCLEKDPGARYQTAGALAADLRKLGAESGAAPRAATAGTETIAVPAASRKRRLRLTTAPLALVLLVLLAAAIPGMRHGVARWIAPDPLPAQKRVAVLLFQNVGGNPSTAVLADGLIEVVSNALTRLEQFHGALVVVPASDVRKEGVRSARDAGRLLAANLAITGSVQTIGGPDVLVTLNLVDTRTVSQLRAETIRARLPDLAALQDGVVEKVTRMLELSLAPEAAQEVKAGGTTVAGAYASYLEGLGYLRRSDRPENLELAIAAFGRAVAKDAGYALAYAGAAEAYWLRYDLLRDTRAIEPAVANGRRALALNDKLAPVHITLGSIEAGREDYGAAEREFQRALTLDPRSADAYRALGSMYQARGRMSEAEAVYRKAIDMRPDDWGNLKQIGLFYLNTGQYTEAEHYLREVIRLTPDSAKAYSNLAVVYVRMNRPADAALMLAKSIAIEPTANACNTLGYLYYYEGEFAEAAEQFEQAVKLVPTDSRFWGNLADAYRWSPALAAKAPETYRKAIDLIGKEIAIRPKDAELHSRLAMYQAAAGDRRAAKAEIERSLKLQPRDGAVEFRAALVWEQAGQRERAFGALGAALHAGYAMDEIRKAPPLARLREDPRFSRLAASTAPAGPRGKPQK